MIRRRRIGVFALYTLGVSASATAAGPGPSIVSVSGRVLTVQKRQADGSLAPAAPYVIRGVNWSPASQATTDDPASRRAALVVWAATDAARMSGLNVNTVRLYLDPGLDASGLSVLDQLWSQGIMVVLTVDGGTNDLARVEQVVSFYKDHPAVLMWMLGSEWNINLYFGNPGCNTPLKAAQCTQSAAQLVKSLDTNHPVATSYGEIDINASGLHLTETKTYVNDVCTDVDVWSLNIFRSQTFGNLFDQWRSITSKPMLLGEFGTDAMVHPADLPDDTMQAGWDLCLWSEAISELSAVQPSLVNLGAMAFEWNDEWWKVAPSGSQENGGDVGGHPDGFANEEWFGMVDIDRNARHTATAFGAAFLGTYRRPPRGLIFGTASRGYKAAQYGGQGGFSRFYECGKTFYARNGGAGGGRGFNAVVLNATTGAQLQAPQTFDTWGTRDDCAANAPGAAMSALVTYLNAAPAGSLVLLSVGDEAGLNQNLSCSPYGVSSCFTNGLAALAALGSTKIQSYCYGDSWAMIAVKGQGVLAEGLATGDRVSLQTPLPDPGSFNMTVTKAGAGQGSVTSSPAGLSCGVPCANATAAFPTGTLVALTPVAVGGSAFADWSGDPDCANGVVAVDRDKTCAARFEPAVALTVTKSGTGAGKVASSPAGIDCGVDCSEGYALGTPVTLTATPGALSLFAGWSGACTGTGTCTVSMDGAKAVTADFTKIPGLSFYDVTPCRVSDSREAPFGPALLGGELRTVPVGSQCGVPPDAKAVSLNVTVTTPTDPGDLRLFPAGGDVPPASAINYAAGQTRANNAIVALGDGGAVVVFCEQASGTAHLIVDVNGFFR